MTALTEKSVRFTPSFPCILMYHYYCLSMLSIKKMFFDSIVIERKRKYRPILGRRKWKGQEKGKDTSRVENWV